MEQKVVQEPERENIEENNKRLDVQKIAVDDVRGKAIKTQSGKEREKLKNLI